MYVDDMDLDEARDFLEERKDALRVYSAAVPAPWDLERIRWDIEDLERRIKELGGEVDSSPEPPEDTDWWEVTDADGNSTQVIADDDEGARYHAQCSGDLHVGTLDSWNVKKI